MNKVKIAYPAFILFATVLVIPSVFVLAQIETQKPADITSRSYADPGGVGQASDSVASSSIPTVAAPRTSVPAQISRMPSPSQTIPPQSKPTPEPITPAVSTNGTSSESGNNNLFVGIVSGLIALIGALIAYKIYKSKSEDKDNENKRCGNIKELLEQKKKELEEAVRNWPKEKIKEVAKDSILDEVSKNKTAGKIVDTAENVKEKYDKLIETVEMLQRRYDLCMLEMPSSSDTFKGTIVENSLKDKKILDNLHIDKTRQLDNWLLHDVAVSEKQIEKLGQCLDDGPWYMHFWQEGKDDVIVVFQDKSFKIKYSDRSTWAKATEHGRSLGISAEQLDFSVRSELNRK